MDNWNYLKTVIEPKNNYYKFKRDERILEKYNNFSKNIIDIHSYLMKTLFPKNEKITFKISLSVSLSKAEVASSKIKTSGF